MRADELIPGARDESTLTHRQPGAMGGEANGADIPAAEPEWMDEDTRRERQIDGGGAPRERDNQ